MRIDRGATRCWSVDLQHDFLPGGALAVAGGDEIVAPIARARAALRRPWSRRRTGTRRATSRSPPPTQAAAVPDARAAPGRRRSSGPTTACGGRAGRRSTPALPTRRVDARAAQGDAASRSTPTAPSARTSARTAGGRPPASAPGSPRAACGASSCAGWPATSACGRARWTPRPRGSRRGPRRPHARGVPGSASRRRTRRSRRRACGSIRSDGPRAGRRCRRSAAARRPGCERGGTPIEASGHARARRTRPRTGCGSATSPTPGLSTRTTWSSASPARRSAARTCTCSTGSFRTRASGPPSVTSSPASSRRSARACASLARGDRVVVPFNVSCGTCFFCRRGLYGDCESSNPMSELASRRVRLLAHRPAATTAARRSTSGCPFADVGPMKIPDDLADEDVLLLSDVLPTGYQAAEMGGVAAGDVVAVFGCGPVGLVAARSAWLLGAARVVAIDRIEARLAVRASAGRAPRRSTCAGCAIRSRR